ncbi:NHL repeat-containing protein [Lysobacter xanthus]
MNIFRSGLRRAAFAVALVPAALVAPAQAQTVSTTAGNGTVGYSGDGGPATSASLSAPIGVDADAAGNRYIADYTGFRVRKVDPAGTISTVVGTGARGFSGDGGPASAAAIGYVYDIAADRVGNLYLADYENQRIRRIAADGTISTIAGTGVQGSGGDGGPAVNAQLDYPVGVAVDAGGAVYFTEYGGCRIRKIGVDGTISLVAGTTCGYSGDNGPATAAQISNPVNLTVDSAGNVLLSEYISNRIRRIDTSGVITTIAGTGAPGSTGDGGPATVATFTAPWGLATDGAGNLYVSELTGARIRRIAPNGIVTTFAGTGVPGYNGDGQAASVTQFTTPAGLAIANGALYVAEYQPARLRRIALFTTCAAQGYTGSKLTMCKQVCEGSATGSTLNALIKMYVTLYKEQPACSR